jgi:hypothetical protein
MTDNLLLRRLAPLLDARRLEAETLAQTLAGVQLALGNAMGADPLTVRVAHVQPLCRLAADLAFENARQDSLSFQAARGRDCRRGSYSFLRYCRPMCLRTAETCLHSNPGSALPRKMKSAQVQARLRVSGSRKR